MARANKTYGFTIAVKELKETVPNLFRYASAFKRTNNITSKGLWEMFLEKPDPKPKEQAKKDKLPEEVLKLDPNSGKLPDVDPESMEDEKYNMCHFWSNFEIARLDFFRSKPYEDFFQMMDKSGGFWTERVSIRATCTNFPRMLIADYLRSGEMLRFIPLLLVPSLAQQTFTTSVTLVTDTPPFSIALPMLLPDNYLDRNSLRSRPLILKSRRKRTTTGKTGMPRKRMVWGAGADVIRIS